MPYPSEHTARIKDPTEFKEQPDWAKKGQKFARVSDGTIFGRIKVPKTIDVIWGQLKSQSGKAAYPQTLRFPTKDWTAERAKKWLKDNNVPHKSFEAASAGGRSMEIDRSVTGINQTGVTHARSLVSSGKVKDSASWNPPSADKENSYIKTHTIEQFGSWHLGVDSSVPKDAKGHYGYIFTSDFVNVDRKGIIAIKQRASQQNETTILGAVTKILDQIDKKKNGREFVDESLGERSAQVAPDTYNAEAHSVRAILATENPVAVIDWGRMAIVKEVLLMSGYRGPASAKLPMIDSHARGTIEATLGSARDIQVVGRQLEGNLIFSTTDKGQKAETNYKEGHLTDVSISYSRGPAESEWIPAGEKSTIEGKEYTGPMSVVRQWSPIELSAVIRGADEYAKVRSSATPEIFEHARALGFEGDAKPEELMAFIGERSKLINEGVDPDADSQDDPTPSRSHTTVNPTGRLIMGKTTKDPQDGDNLEQMRTEEEVLQEERDRITEIEAVAAKHTARVPKMDELRTKAIKDGWTAERFKGEILEQLPKGEPLETPASELDLTQKQQRDYSLLRLIQYQITDGKVKADFERECAQEIIKRSAGKTWHGMPIPWDIQNRAYSVNVSTRRELDTLRAIAMEHGLRHAERALDTTSQYGASELVGTTLRADLFIDMLYNKALAAAAGVQILTGIQSNFTLPKKTSAGTWEWTGEPGTTSGSALATGSITWSPKEGRAFEEYTRMLMLQSTPSIELLVQNDLLTIARLGIDKAVFHGSGTSYQPKGIEKESGIGAVDGADIGLEAIVDHETKVAVGNADIGSMFYIMSPTTRGILKTRFVAPNTSERLMLADGTVNGYDSLVSNQIEDGYIFFGNFSDELLVYFGNLDLLVNPYAGDKTGTIRVNVYADVDCRLRRAASISMSDDVS
jgi:hypothetical protein